MKTGSLSSNVVFLFLEKIIFTIVLFGVNIYLIRTLDMADFGQLALFQLVLVFLISIGELGMRQVVISIRDDNDFHRVSFDMFLLKVFVSVVLLFGILFLVGVGVLDEGYYLFIAVLIFSPFDLCQYYFERKLRNDVLVCTRLTVLIVLNSLRIYLCSESYNLVYIIASFVLEKPLQNIVLLILYLVNKDRQAIKYHKPKDKEYLERRNFALKRAMYFLMSMVFVQLNMRLDQIAVTTLLGELSLAIYVVAYKFISPVLSAFDVLNNIVLAHFIKKDESYYKKYLRLVYSVVFLALVPVSLTLFFLADYIVLLLVGDEYLDSVILLKALSIILPLMVLNNVGGVYYSLYFIEKIAFYKNLLAFVVSLLVNFILIGSYGFEGIVLSIVVNAVLLTFIIELLLKESSGNSKLKFQSIFSSVNTIKILKGYILVRLGNKNV
jgi:O-antigen/teichoic acid export membrane protein